MLRLWRLIVLFWFCDRLMSCCLSVHSKRVALIHNSIVKVVNPLRIAVFAHIFFRAIWLMGNLISNPPIVLKAFKIFVPALNQIRTFWGIFHIVYIGRDTVLSLQHIAA